MATNIDDFRNATVNIAVVGQSGSGKSTWVNMFRDITDKNDPLYAKTGGKSTECTTELSCFEFKDNKNLKLWDVPGAGSAKFPVKTYKKVTKMKMYDAFVFLTRSRFMETDVEIAKLIEKTKKPCYFARTHMDVDMQNQIGKLNQFQPVVKQAKLKTFADDLRTECKNALKGIKTLANIFLVTSRKDKDMQGWIPDNEKLKDAILDNLSEIQKTVLSLSLVCRTPEQVDIKEKELKLWIYAASLSAGAGGAIPIPGVPILIDLPIIAANFFHQKKALGIDKCTIEKRAMGYKKRVWSEKEFLDEVKKELAKDSELAAWIPTIFATTVAEIQVSLTTALITSSATTTASVTATAAATAAAASLGFVGAIAYGGTTYIILMQILEANLKAAKGIIRVLDMDQSS